MTLLGGDVVQYDALSGHSVKELDPREDRMTLC